MNVSAIPAEMRARAQWVAWKIVERDGKQTKVPIRADGAGNASTTDPSTWASFADALAAVDRLGAEGVGYVFAPDDGLVGVDLDALDADAAAIIAALDSYTERSVSGRGAHVIVRASLNGHPRNRSGPLEIYERGRFFVMTGDRLQGTPATIEARQRQLDEVLARFLPAPAAAERPAAAAPVDLDDRELLERAFAARNGADLRALYEGDWGGRYPSQSEADLALAAMLAFWTGRDPDRIDRLFRSSGLYRAKWERADYRERTIAEAIAGCRDAYAPPRPERKSDESPAPELPPVEQAAIVVVPVEVFAAVREASAEALLGDDDDTVLAAGGTAMLYGEGGAGKTTAELDLAFHLAGGVPWLGLDVPRRARGLIIEAEGPRGKMRQKLAAKLAAWQGPPVDGWLAVVESPWAALSLANPKHRALLAQAIVDNDAEIVYAGPVAALGLEGGGTPAEVRAFVAHLEDIRARVGRPVAFVLIAHTNKGGQVAGAWEGATDTLAHAQAQGHGKLRLHWAKVRWAPTLHGTTWHLLWREGETYALEDKPEITADEVADSILAAIARNPGCSGRTIEKEAVGSTERKREVRDQLLEDGAIVNVPKGRTMRLYLADDPELEQVRLMSGAPEAHPAPPTGEGGFGASAPRASLKRRAAQAHPHSPAETDPGAAAADDGATLA